MATIPVAKWSPPTTLPEGMKYLKGQQEIGEGGFHHWQIYMVTCNTCRLPRAKLLLCREAYLEPTRSKAAEQYVWKETTAVGGTRFELGVQGRPGKNAVDWIAAYELVKAGRVLDVDPGLQIRHMGSLLKIQALYSKPEFRMNLDVNVYWGPTGTGKSHSAWTEAQAFGDVYIKQPSTKWWDGYSGEENVIIDEFCGEIGITHLLRWLDKYPCSVEVKGSQVALRAKRFWICSNIEPRLWYTCPMAQQEALTRRLLNVVNKTESV